jgi:uncharacterized membrane protein
VSYLQQAYFHLATVFPAFLIGAYLLLSQKGTPGHRMLGKIYMSLMLVTAITTLFMSAKVGPAFMGHFGFIHLLSFLVIYSVPAAFFAARSGNIVRHRRNMIGVYVGGILVAGAFTFLPGRLLHDWIIA